MGEKYTCLLSWQNEGKFHKNVHLSSAVAHKAGHPACAAAAADVDVHNFVRPAFVAVAAADEDDEGAATWAGEDELAFHRDGAVAVGAYTWPMGPSEVEQACPS